VTILMFVHPPLLRLKSIEHSGIFGSSFPGYLLIVLDIPLSHDLMHDNTYKSLAAGGILVHNVPVADSCDM
jgi:hypothetical protein